MQFLIDIVLISLYLSAFFLLCAWIWRFWKLYINQKYLNKVNKDAIMLEIKLPREITKSPLAMEIALASLLQGGGLSPVWYKQLFLGNLPAYSSLEIASLEGIIHFYIRLDKKFRPLVESNLYAQYPGIEIIEADDYTKLIRYHHGCQKSGDVSIWGANYTLSKTWDPIDEKTGKHFPDPEKPKDKDAKYSMKADFLPIKTYVDYGLDKDPKEELKTDPLTTLLEFMGSVGKGEYVWHQILVQDESVYNKKMPKFFINEITHKRFTLSEMAKEHIKKIRTASYIVEKTNFTDKYGDIEFKKSGKKDAEGKDIMIPALHPSTKAEMKKEMDLTQDEKNQIEAINKKMSKPLAMVVIRLLYLSNNKITKFNGGHIQNILAYPKPYSGLNSFAPSPTDPYDYPWQNIGGKRTAWRSEEKFEEFVEREGFFPHIPERKSMDLWEDMFFWNSSMKTRKLFRMFYEAIFYPFSHPTPKQISVLNMEELATLWHLPGTVANTPTLPRIDSNKGVAPVNLPQ